MTNKIIYLGAFLRHGQKDLLLELVQPRHTNIHADHVTMVFGPSPAEARVFADPDFGSLGRTCEIEVFGEVWDHKGQAVLVRGIKSHNAHPHITISTAKGVKPVYSNEMMSEGTVKLFKHPFTLNVELDTYPSSMLIRLTPKRVGVRF